MVHRWDWRPPKLDLIYSPEEPAPTNATLHNNNQNEEDDENGDEGQRGRHNKGGRGEGRREGLHGRRVEGRVGAYGVIDGLIYIVCWCGAEGAVIDTAKVRHMLELLSAEAGFLVDPKVPSIPHIEGSHIDTRRGISDPIFSMHPYP